MKSRATSITASALAIVATALLIVPDNADARRIGGVHRVGHINFNAHNVARRARHVGRWVNGVWVVNGVAASVAVGTASNCPYYRRKWRETGSAYWRDRWQENCT